MDHHDLVIECYGETECVVLNFRELFYFEARPMLTVIQ